ncbi:hypothetical protein AGMMS49965_03160 [Bacteroidia bacterium]|nr:hypothetical protein AGMMS49965_03160 [Bacteroidia bacterium]
MTVDEIITVVALILGPILAVQVATFLERRRNVKNRRVDIFKTLMATRGSSLSMAHVEALNRIDLEFSNDKKYKKIVEAWKEYFDNLGQRVETDEQFIVWTAKNEELLANLLYEMGQSLGYKFDKVLIKRNIYSPVGHANVEKENGMIRRGLLDFLNSEVTIPMTLINDDATLQKQAEFQELLTKYYQKELEK